MESCERRRRTGMAVKHTPILLYGGDKILQSIKKKKKNFLFIKIKKKIKIKF